MNLNRVLLKHSEMNFLRLSLSNLILDDIYFELLSQSLISFKNLEHLELFLGGNENINNQLASEILYNIGFLKNLTYLELDFGFTKIDSYIFFLNQNFGADLKNLKYLYLHINGIVIDMNLYNNLMIFISRFSKLEAIKLRIKDSNECKDILNLLKKALSEEVKLVKIIY